jgi:hypothetical protein
MSNIVLLGLPGLYQNWLMAAVDPTSKVQLHGDQNFFCSKSQVKWVIKSGLVDYPVASDDLTVINLTVNENNFPWYMYNLYEKTYDIKIMIETFAEDIVKKGDKFSFFAETKKELLCQFTNLTNDNLIRYFYKLFRSNNHYLYTATRETRNNYINIEFDDFTQPDLLCSKLSRVPGFDSIHFYSSYKLLVDRNFKYLNKKKDFYVRLTSSCLNYDIIETAYIGKLASIIFNKELDWGNPNIRQAVLKHKQQEISDLAKELC